MATAKPAFTVQAHVAAKLQTQDPDQWAVTFQPDYTEGANAAWAKGTPAAAVEVNVLAAVADRFEPGEPVMITFTPGV